MVGEFARPTDKDVALIHTWRYATSRRFTAEQPQLLSYWLLGTQISTHKFSEPLHALQLLFPTWFRTSLRTWREVILTVCFEAEHYAGAQFPLQRVVRCLVF